MAKIEVDEWLTNYWPRLEFEDDLSKFKCVKCEDLAVRHFLSDCGHIICHTCCEQLINDNEKFNCPKCHCAMTKLMTNKSNAFQNELFDLFAKCPNSKNKIGCPNVLTISELVVHENKCKYKANRLEVGNNDKKNSKMFDKLQKCLGNKGKKEKTEDKMKVKDCADAKKEVAERKSENEESTKKRIGSEYEQLHQNQTEIQTQNELTESKDAKQNNRDSLIGKKQSKVAGNDSNGFGHATKVDSEDKKISPSNLSVQDKMVADMAQKAIGSILEPLFDLVKKIQEISSEANEVIQNLKEEKEKLEKQATILIDCLMKLVAFGMQIAKIELEKSFDEYLIEFIENHESVKDMLANHSAIFEILKKMLTTCYEKNKQHWDAVMANIITVQDIIATLEELSKMKIIPSNKFSKALTSFNKMKIAKFFTKGN